MNDIDHEKVLAEAAHEVINSDVRAYQAGAAAERPYTPERLAEQ
ncbi:MAG: hypothetical protein AB7H90_00945 [Alphaproteobacteria bacterium]